MWKLTPDAIQRAKEELKGRRAAIEARYADEVKTIDSDLVDIETLERVADAFALKHLGDDTSDELEPEVEPTPSSDPGPVPVSALSWRRHLNRQSEAE